MAAAGFQSEGGEVGYRDEGAAVGGRGEGGTAGCQGEDSTAGYQGEGGAAGGRDEGGIKFSSLFFLHILQAVVKNHLKMSPTSSCPGYNFFIV